MSTKTLGRAPDPAVARRRQRVLALFEAGMKPKQILDPVRADFGDHVSLVVVYSDIKWLRAKGAVAKRDKVAQEGGEAAADPDLRCVELNRVVGSAPGPILARRRERVRALFQTGMKPRQIAEHVRREFGANLRITLVYRDITWLRANGMINSEHRNKARDEDLDRRCVELKQAGRSYDAIAGELGISRSAVAGRFHRLRRQDPTGMRQRKQKAGEERTKPDARRSKRSRRSSPVLKRAARTEHPDPSPIIPPNSAYPPGAPTAVMTAKPGTCRWPIGEPRDSDFRFCGAKALDGSSWCADCAARAWPDGRTSGGAS